MADQQSQPFSKIALQVFKALSIAVTAFITVLLISLLIFHLVFSGKIFPGVHVNGYPIGGMTVEQAAVAITQHLVQNEINQIQLTYLDAKYPVKPSDIGISIDAVRTAISAFNFGRSFPFSKWLTQQPLIFSQKVELAPTLIFNQNAAINKLQNIASKEDSPLVEATLSFNGTQVVSSPGQIGRSLNFDASLTTITDKIRNGIPEQIELTISETQPALLDASPFIANAQSILNQPFIIKVPNVINANTMRWTITPDNLAPMLTFTPTSDNPKILVPQFTNASIDGLLASIAEQVDVPPQNPRFIFNDETFQLDLYNEGIPGIEVDLIQSKAAVQSAIAAGYHDADLAVDIRSPEIADTASGKELGITELVHVESSYFYGSDNARIQNIEKAANEFLGLLVMPGETFSMASAMGDISLDNGYSEALIIYNGKTIEGVGGGVCQVSTTLFRSAFFTGFPIIERHPHAYRVSYYEKVAGNYRDTDLAGLDATVYIPLVDLKFINDTPYWLLMEAYVNRATSRITWKFYSTYDGRTMDWRTTGLSNTIEPKKPLYILNDELQSGEIKQVDWEAEGADVTINRTVYKDGDILFEDSYFTRYAPWRAVYEYGPGTEGIPQQNDE